MERSTRASAERRSSFGKGIRYFFLLYCFTNYDTCHSCLTPRYVASPMCNREVTLADVLHKPILPLIIEFTPWPPPGAMALIMSSIVYIDLCGKWPDFTITEGDHPFFYLFL